MDEALDENAIRELEELLGTKIYPGTEIMRDVGTHHFVKASGANVLVPQPADDPADPLNWTAWWKASAIFAATLLSFSLNLGPLALAPMFNSYVHEWDRSLADVVQFTGVAILVLGFSNFIWVPIMVAWGRRPVAIFSTLICLCSSIWRARATSYNSFMGASVLNGIGAGPCETLMPQVIADIIFLHDRGKYQTLYFSLYFMSLMAGPIISGAMDYHVGWRNFWWFNTGLLGLTLAVQVLMLPETLFDRAGATAATTAARTAAAAASAAAEKTSNDGAGAAEHEDAADTNAGSSATPADAAAAPATGEAAAAAPAADVADPVDRYLGISRPGRKSFYLFQRNGPATWLRELWLPWYLHLFAIVEFAAFNVSFSASAFLVVNLSQTQAFAGPPYLYSSQTIGLFNLAVLVGAAIGLFTCGPLSDLVAAALTRRNNGVREPEMRLVAMAPYVVAMVIGSIVVAVGYDHHWPWQAIVIVGYSLLGLQVTALPSIASTYAIDSYRPVTGSMFVTITVNKNVWGYGVSKFLTTWAEESGFTRPILTVMAATLFFSLCAIPFWYYGKRVRGFTASSFVHKL